MGEECFGDIAIQLEVIRLVADYARLLDDRDAGGWTALFTDHGVISIGADRHFEGKEALAGFLARTPRGVHVPGVPNVHVFEGGARAQSSMLFLAADTGESRAVVNDDHMIWVDGRLRIAERKIDIRADSGS